MNAALQRKLVAVRALMAKATGDEVRTRYEIAIIIQSIQNAPDKYGSRGVNKLALALGCDRATLYRYGQVRRVFGEKAMRAILAAQKRTRGAVSWSHLVVLSAVSNDAERRRLLEAAMNGVSTRALTQQAHGESADAPTNNASLRRFIAMSESFESRAMLELDLSNADVVDVDALLKSQEELREICERNLNALRDAKQTLALRTHLQPLKHADRPRRLLAG